MDCWEDLMWRRLDRSLCHSLAGRFEALGDPCRGKAVDGGAAMLPVTLVRPRRLLLAVPRVDEPRHERGMVEWACQACNVRLLAWRQCIKMSSLGLECSIKVDPEREPPFSGRETEEAILKSANWPGQARHLFELPVVVYAWTLCSNSALHSLSKHRPACLPRLS